MADYLVELVGLTPSQTGPPDRRVVAPLHSWTSLSVADELSRAGHCHLSIPVAQIDVDARPYLADPFANPCELEVRRDGSVIFAGPVRTNGIRGDTVQVRAPGLLGWLRHAYLDDDVGALDLEDMDQHAIPAALVDAWQALDYGDVGIDTSQVTDAGKLRTRRYTPDQQREVYDALTRLCDQWDLDMAVDPASRELKLWTPRRERDRTDAFFLDAANIDSADEQRSAAPGSVATVVHAVSNPGGDDEQITAMARDTAAMAQRFRLGHPVNERDISEQSTLDDRAQDALDARAALDWQPGPELSVVVDREWGDVEPGDLVAYQFDAGLGMREEAVRVVTRRLDVDGGVERLSVEVA